MQVFLKWNMIYLHKTDRFWEIINAFEIVFMGVKQIVRMWIGPSYYSIEIKSTYFIKSSSCPDFIYLYLSKNIVKL